MVWSTEYLVGFPSSQSFDPQIKGNGTQLRESLICGLKRKQKINLLSYE